MGDLHGLRKLATTIVGPDRIWADEATLLLHSYDASLERGSPDLVVRPRNTHQLQTLVMAAHRYNVPYVARGAGTGYSGGALPAAGGMVLLTADLDRILDFDTEKGLIRCEPGVVLANLKRHVASGGWRYPPDPSSHEVCTIGGNVAENAGGPHALGAGPTANYVTTVEVIRPDGRVVTLDEGAPWDGGLDLRSLIVGAEGTLGVVSAMTLRLVRPPEVEQVVLGTFTAWEAAVSAVADVFAGGLLPSALDMLTGAFVPSDPSLTDNSLLFVEVAGHSEETAAQVEALSRCVSSNGGQALRLDVPEFLAHRADLVRDKVRRMVTATGYPRYYLFDAVAPRSQLRALMDAICTAAADHHLPVLNTFHAGDGNVHPTPFYDPRDPGCRDRLLAFSAQVLRRCERLGGALSGEHGIGSEKRQLMELFLQPATLDVMRRVKHAVDPTDLCNPGKVVPPPRAARPATTTIPRGGRPGSKTPRVNLTDAVLEVTDADTTFADVSQALADTPYELVYEPLGATASSSVFKAFDLGLPGLRERMVRARDLIVGAVLRQPDGVQVSVGGRCCKDVAGYELRKLVYGSRGRLGNLVELRLRLHPRPSDRHCVRTHAPSLQEALDSARTIETLGLPWSYLGVVVRRYDAAVLVGRVETRGGQLDRHRERLTSAGITECTSATADWQSDLPIEVLATGAGELRSATWTDRDELVRLIDGKDCLYLPAGTCRIWWRGEPPTTPELPSDLDAAVAQAFQGST